MCRLAAYLGTEISLGKLILDPPHSLQVQSWAPRELRYAKLNADGYGFAWYPDSEQPAVYVNPMPIWTDPNLRHLAGALRSELWVASVRSATTGNPVSHANTQPFIDQKTIFDHNGLIDDFHQQVRPAVASMLKPGYLASIQGNTESEYLFAMLRQILDENQRASMQASLTRFLGQVEGCLHGQKALLNLVVADRQRLYAVRHSIDDPCPSLYYTIEDEAFPDAQLIASERLTTSSGWQPVPEHHILIIDRRKPPELIPL